MQSDELSLSLSQSLSGSLSRSGSLSLSALLSDLSDKCATDWDADSDSTLAAALLGCDGCDCCESTDAAPADTSLVARGGLQMWCSLSDFGKVKGMGIAASDAVEYSVSIITVVKAILYNHK